MANYKLTTVFYKYKRFAAGWIILYAIVVLGFYFIAKGNPYLIALWIAIMVVPPVWGALRSKSIFSLRAWDDRKLILTPTYIQVGDDKYEFTDVQAVAIYLGGYDGFSYNSFDQDPKHKKKGAYSVNGDDNVLAFRYQGKAQSYEFYLSDFDSYAAICHIIDSWKNSKKSFVLKEQFSRDFIRKHVRIN
jgi:hypothetical protein